jgi:hypothetical protein
MEQLKKISSEYFFPYLISNLQIFLRYTREHASDEEMREAARQANALKFIEDNQFGNKLFPFVHEI